MFILITEGLLCAPLKLYAGTRASSPHPDSSIPGSESQRRPFPAVRSPAITQPLLSSCPASPRRWGRWHPKCLALKCHSAKGLLLFLTPRSDACLSPLALALPGRTPGTALSGPHTARVHGRGAGPAWHLGGLYRSLKLTSQDTEQEGPKSPGEAAAAHGLHVLSAGARLASPRGGSMATMPVSAARLLGGLARALMDFKKPLREVVLWR